MYVHMIKYKREKKSFPHLDGIFSNTFSNKTELIYICSICTKICILVLALRSYLARRSITEEDCCGVPINEAGNSDQCASCFSVCIRGDEDAVNDVK